MSKTLTQALVVLALSGPAVAQTNNATNHTWDRKEDFKQLLAKDLDGHTIFEADRNACLRGPLAIYNSTNNELFRLMDGVFFPTGCEKRQ